jgi:hypothetical protein
MDDDEELSAMPQLPLAIDTPSPSLIAISSTPLPSSLAINSMTPPPTFGINSSTPMMPRSKANEQQQPSCAQIGKIKKMKRGSMSALF